MRLIVAICSVPLVPPSSLSLSLSLSLFPLSFSLQWVIIRPSSGFLFVPSHSQRQVSLKASCELLHNMSPTGIHKTFPRQDSKKQHLTRKSLVANYGLFFCAEENKNKQTSAKSNTSVFSFFLGINALQMCRTEWIFPHSWIEQVDMIFCWGFFCIREHYKLGFYVLAWQTN